MSKRKRKTGQITIYKRYA